MSVQIISTYFTIEMIYLWLNIGVLPFWLVLIFFPQSNISKILTTSIFPIIVFGTIYSYLIYLFFYEGFDFTENFKLYLGIENLIALLSNKKFLILFWIHFLVINLFCGCWIVKDSAKYNVPKFLIFFPLIFTYFIGVIGIFFYWIIKIFYAKKISLYD